MNGSTWRRGALAVSLAASLGAAGCAHRYHERYPRRAGYRCTVEIRNRGPRAVRVFFRVGPGRAFSSVGVLARGARTRIGAPCGVEVYAEGRQRDDDDRRRDEGRVWGRIVTRVGHVVRLDLRRR